MNNVQINYEQIVAQIRQEIYDLRDEIIRNDEYAPIFSSSATYEVGQYAWYQNVLYRCISAVTEAGNFDANDWEVVQEEEVLARFNNFYAVISPFIHNVNFYVNLEQAFLKSEEKLDPNGVYVAVRFNRASVNFGSSLCNVSLSILGTANKVKPTQLFFSAFASKYSLQTLNGQRNTQQIWVTPSVQSNFNEFAAEFRNLFEVSGTLIIGNNTVGIIGGYITYHYGQNDSEDIPFLTFQDNFRNNLSPQPYGNTEGFSVSETNFSTYTFTISTYLLDSQLVADCMKAKGFILNGSGRTSTKEPNSDFVFTFTFSNGYTNNRTDKALFKTFKLIDCTMSHSLGEIPTFTASFTH